MDFKCIFETYLIPLIPLVAVYVVYRLGKKSYFQQKEYEMVVSRYLEEGIDATSQKIDESLAIFRHNWSHALTALKNFRDLGVDMNPSLYSEGLIGPNTTHLEFWRSYRLEELLGTKTFNKAQQLLDAFVRNTYTLFKDDICHGLRITVEGGKELEVTAPPEVMVEKFLKIANEKDAESYRFYALLAILQRLATIIQTERLDFKGLKALKNRDEVKAEITKLEQLFPENADNVASM